MLLILLLSMMIFPIVTALIPGKWLGPWVIILLLLLVMGVGEAAAEDAPTGFFALMICGAFFWLNFPVAVARGIIAAFLCWQSHRRQG